MKEKIDFQRLSITMSLDKLVSDINRRKASLNENIKNKDYKSEPNLLVRYSICHLLMSVRLKKRRIVMRVMASEIIIGAVEIKDL